MQVLLSKFHPEADSTNALGIGDKAFFRGQAGEFEVTILSAPMTHRDYPDGSIGYECKHPGGQAFIHSSLLSLIRD